MGEELQLPAVDMIDRENEVVVKATLPGMKADDIEVTTVGNTLTIKGEFKEEREEEEEGEYIYRERRYGSFNRSFTLPDEINTDEADAEFEDGVLTLTLSKTETEKQKSISIKSK